VVEECGVIEEEKRKYFLPYLFKVLNSLKRRRKRVIKGDRIGVVIKVYVRHYPNLEAPK
jgi:hypothetical protein